MRNLNNYSINFNGGYRFRNMPSEAKAKIPEINNKWKQVFYDFENKGDVFLVTRDKLDSKVADFIKENNLEFEFFPQISTKSGLDTEEPEKLTILLKELNTKPITTLTQLRKAIHKQIINTKIFKTSPDYSFNILKTLHISPENLELEIAHGIITFNDKEFRRKIHISRPKNRVHYVLVEPYSSAEGSRRFAINSDGKFIESFNTPDKIIEFYKGFRKSALK